MADCLFTFQMGRDAAMRGDVRDARRSPDWLEGYDQVANESFFERETSIE
jgi:hypothetical protein